ncbi:phage integrase SAM-like domain-containing protein [Flavobacterium psychrophilum]|uniref:phage integrase SAM-like domain-containing protein n=1 Tax=Flavobacterium psychrophilum TaxID=96345 RepID=UPI000B7C2186|nr:phage integrase SAM-like domain-containing protein [Flavobacterium psychrophilum]SNA67265.1 Phage integrase family protein [Flavobacterium psychrophilum]
MATLKYVLQSKSENSNIYIRYSINRKTILYRKTGFVINSKEWSKPNANPIQKSQELKALKSKLDKLATFINDAYNDGISEGEDFTGDWLQLQIDLFNNKTPVLELDVFTTYIQKYIDDSPYKQNAKKELGLSNGRVQNLKLFKNTVLKYEVEVLKGKSILIRNINLKFVEQYKGWMFGKGYSTNYVGKNIANIRTVCLDASKNDIETSTQIKNIKGISESREPEDIVFLSEDEQEAIKNVPLIREALINARKWLLLGCLIGQRGGDLMNITAKNIKELNGIKIIELKQQKTGKLVAIPLLPEAIEIIESGLPYKTSLVHFNIHIKDICQEAGLNELTKGRIKVKQGQPSVKKLYPKYEVISSHVCRRSFCTNFYGRIPTPVLMNISAHGTEKMFLKYIGKTTYDNAYQMLEYFSKLAPKEKTQPAMEVIRNTGK